MLRFLSILAGGLLLWSASAMADGDYSHCLTPSETTAISQPQETIFLAANPCAQVVCTEPGTVCRGGACVVPNTGGNPCAQVVCTEPGAVCRGGACVVP
jgi:hypothetical protein